MLGEKTTEQILTRFQFLLIRVELSVRVEKIINLVNQVRIAEKITFIFFDQGNDVWSLHRMEADPCLFVSGF